MSNTSPKHSDGEKPALPTPPQAKPRGDGKRSGAPDLRLEEVEEKHVPKDRNIFDK